MFCRVVQGREISRGATDELQRSVDRDCANFASVVAKRGRETKETHRNDLIRFRSSKMQAMTQIEKEKVQKYMGSYGHWRPVRDVWDAKFPISRH